ncbi:hypothetical protein Fcan01_24509 [Folsomia candida]|uniref:Uncharacterized protein n=1 Tax=Folsomia candida TaxID=158441 RepID=A0A226D6Z9_FOLCA|nr:hypothetical protein Fcan01_24509 [Folsomia candida]
MTIYIHCAKLSEFPTWLFMLSTVLEEGYGVPADIERKQFFRLTMGLWCLMSVILTNCYNGIMTTELNAPLQGGKLKTFSDLVCPKIMGNNQNPDHVLKTFGNFTNLDFSRHREYLRSYYTSWRFRGVSYLLGRQFEDADCFKILSNLIPSGFENNVPDFLLAVTHMRLLYPGLNVKKASTLHFPNTLATLTFNLLNPVHSHHPAGVGTNSSAFKEESFRKLVETEIISCDKTVFTSDLETVNIELGFLRKHYHWIQFYKGDEIIYSTPIGFDFYNSGVSKVPTHYRILFESGIYSRLEIEQWRNSLLNRKPAIRKKEEEWDKAPIVSITGSLLTAFIIFAGSFSLPMIFLVVECRAQLKMWVYGMRKLLKLKKLM